MNTRVASRFVAPLLLTALLAGRAQLQEFQPGDLYLVSQGLAIGGSFGTSGVMRVDTVAGTAQVTYHSPTALIGGVATFDPFRNAIIVSPGNLWAVKADGTAADLGVVPGFVGCLAATGDGRIYWVSITTAQLTVQYVDSGNVMHNLLDASGTSNFGFQCCGEPTCAFYDSVSNALFFGGHASGASCGLGDVVAVHKVQLNANGSQVVGSMQTATICAPGDIIGLSAGPGNTLLAVYDDNNNNVGGRMVTIDRTTLAASTYASNGPYTGAAATNAGVYSHLLGRAVIFDTFNDRLALFSAGETGFGTTWNADPLLSNHGGSGEHAFLIEIPNTITTGLAAYGTGTPGCAGAQALFATGSPKAGSTTFRFTCTGAPPSALGLLLIGNVPSVAGVDPFGLGILLHVDLIASTFLDGLDLNANGLGAAQSPAPIPISASLIGQTVDAQAIWAWSGCSTASPFGLSSSNGLAVTFQM